MGGRGSYSGKSTAKNSTSSILGDKVLDYNPNTLSDVRGASKSSNPEGYHNNCQRCVVAMEARMQGYDVEALPTHENDPYRKNNAWTKFFGKDLNALNWINGNDPAPTVKSTKTKILEKMGEWGPNSRAVLAVKWADRSYGHAMMLVNTGFGVQLLDPQTGVIHSMNSILSKSSLNQVRILRVDDANLDNEYIGKAVKKRG